MQIIINTDRHMHGGESLAATVRAIVEGALERFNGQITRVDVHLGDENGNKSGGDDKRCMIEAKLEGHGPVAVTQYSETVAQAIDGAAQRLVHRIDHTLGRQQGHRRQGAPVPIEPD